MLRRYKRFLVDIESETGDVHTAYCPATGRMRSCYKVGAPVEYFPVSDSNRRTNYDWWSIRMPESWVVIDTRPANQLLETYANDIALPDGWSHSSWQSEPPAGDGTRFDFLISTSPYETWIEVKSVTWCQNRVGYFPDAPSERACRHLKELIKKSQDQRAAVVFVTMRSDIEEIRPAGRVDPDFTALLSRARNHGVRVIGIHCRVTSQSVTPNRTIPVRIP